MDESWRMRMGMDPFFSSIARKSMDQTCSSAAMEADDFSDVFGGPPRSVLTRKFSGDFTHSCSFYDEIFRPPESGSRQLPASKSHGRSLPAFRIPAGGDGFYGDVFGCSGGGGLRRGRERTQTKAWSNSSSVLTSEDVSPLRPPENDDVALSSFTSRLRPLNVPSRSRTGQHQKTKKQGIAAYGQAGDFFSGHKNTPGNADFYYESSRRASPETISLDPNSFRSIKLSMEDFGPSSPASSPVSSVCEDFEAKQRTSSFTVEDENDDEEDEDMSSYVIEINSDHNDRHHGGGGSDSIDIDEAIAWAKERFLRPDTKPQITETECQSREESSGDSTLKSPSMEEEEESNSRIGEEEEKSDEQMEMEKDEEITLWLTGKETNIRLLLSTLHHVLWPESGWCVIPLANLQEGSQVKKAYQKARLCLHPDKLQQRGASPSQNYVAKKVFSILQDAWAACVSREGFSN